MGRRAPYEPWRLKAKGSDDHEQALALHVAAALGDELDTARFRLLSEEKDLFHEVDRLSAEGEFRLAVTPSLAAVTAALAASESLLWLAGSYRSMCSCCWALRARNRVAIESSTP